MSSRDDDQSPGGGRPRQRPASGTGGGKETVSGISCFDGVFDDDDGRYFEVCLRQIM